MENTEYVEELLRQFNLGRGAPITEIIEKYLEKSLQIKFQRIVSSQDLLKEEFVRLHETFLKVMKIYQAADPRLQMGVFTPDQLGKFYFNQGVYAMCKENYFQASEKFQEAYKVNKRNVYLLVYMGIILTMRKNYYAAEKYFSEAVKRDPNYDEAWFYSAENYFRAGNFNAAWEHYDKTRQLNPAFNEINLRLKETKEAILRKRRGGKKDSLLRRLVKYIREAFER